MDNRTIDVTSESKEDLAAAIGIAWNNAAGGKATHYVIKKLSKKVMYYGEPTTHHHSVLLNDKENGVNTMILLWYEHPDATPLPFPLDLDGTINFVRGWLSITPHSTNPDIDGSLKDGWRIFTEEWGHVCGYSSTIFAVQKQWAMYGK